jgi:hypothetical protein
MEGQLPPEQRRSRQNHEGELDAALQNNAEPFMKHCVLRALSTR